MYYNEHTFDSTQRKRCKPCEGSGKIGASVLFAHKHTCDYCDGLGYIEHIEHENKKSVFNADKIDRRSKSFKEAINKIMQADKKLTRSEAEAYFFIEIGKENGDQ